MDPNAGEDLQVGLELQIASLETLVVFVHAAESHNMALEITKSFSSNPSHQAVLVSRRSTMLEIVNDSRETTSTTEDDSFSQPKMTHTAPQAPPANAQQPLQLGISLLDLCQSFAGTRFL
ncbi:unnamed protein product, partial [Amoebophrya sp. A120]|eukprot:GSA120T00001572001.1